MKHYVTLLIDEPVLRRLSLIQLISYFGAWFSNVAIYTLLVHLDVSAFIIALIASFHFLPGVLQAPISGVLIDRFSAKKLMLVLLFVEIMSTFSLLLVTSASWLWLLFVLIFIRMGAASFYFTLEMSLLPKILSGKSLQYANEIHSIIWSLSYTLGMALSGFLVYKLGVQTAFIIDGLLFVLSFVMLFDLGINVPTQKKQEHFLDTFKEGLVYLRNNPKIIHLILIHASVGFTVFDALVTLMVKNLYSTFLAIPLGIGILHAVRALGLVVGPLFLGKWINSERLVYLLLFQGLGIIIWGSLIENFYLSLLGSFFTGLCTTTLWSYTYTLIQKHTDKDYYGRVVAYNDMIFLLTSSLISIVIGVMLESDWDISGVLYLLGTVFFMASLYYRYITKAYHV